MQSTTVVVLGGGVGGVVAATRLRQRLGDGHRVVLINREDKHHFPPSYPWVMTGWRKPESTYRQLSVLNKKGIEFVQGEVTEIELDGRTVHTEAGDLSWDYLVVALGSEMDYTTVPGLAETANTYYSLDGAVKLRDALREFKGGKVAVTIAGLPYRCPAAPYEGALLIDQFFRKKT